MITFDDFYNVLKQPSENIIISEARKTTDPFLLRAYEHPIGQELRKIPMTGFYYVKKAQRAYNNLKKEFPDRDDNELFEIALRTTLNESKINDRLQNRLTGVKPSTAVKEWNPTVKMFDAPQVEELPDEGTFEHTLKTAVDEYNKGKGNLNAIKPVETEFINSFGNVILQYTGDEKGQRVYNGRDDKYTFTGYVEAGEDATDAEELPINDPAFSQINMFVKGKIRPIFTYNLAALEGLDEVGSTDGTDNDMILAKYGSTPIRWTMQDEGYDIFTGPAEDGNQVVGYAPSGKVYNKKFPYRIGDDIFEKAEILNNNEQIVGTFVNKTFASKREATEKQKKTRLANQVNQKFDDLLNLSDAQAEAVKVKAKELFGDIFEGDESPDGVRQGIRTLVDDIVNDESYEEFADEIAELSEVANAAKGGDEDDENTGFDALEPTGKPSNDPTNINGDIAYENYVYITYTPKGDRSVIISESKQFNPNVFDNMQRQSSYHLSPAKAKLILEQKGAMAVLTDAHELHLIVSENVVHKLNNQNERNNYSRPGQGTAILNNKIQLLSQNQILLNY